MRRKSMAACMALALVASIATAPAAGSASVGDAEGSDLAAAVSTPTPSDATVTEAMVASTGTREALDHEARDALYSVIDAKPGVHLARAASLAGVALSTARYHVRVLEREGAVDSEHYLGKRRLYPSEHGGERATNAAAHDPTLGPVLEAVASDDPATVPSVASEVDRAPSTVSHHLTRLADAGVVDRERVDGTVAFSLDEGAPFSLDESAL